MAAQPAPGFGRHPTTHDAMTAMTSVHFALVLLFGAAVGALTVLGSRSTEIPAGLLPSLTTVAVGWWINHAIRRQAELERVPLTYISDLSKQIDRLVSMCLDTYLNMSSETSSQLPLWPHAQPSRNGIINLRRLANELHLLTTIINGSNSIRFLSNSLQSSYVDFKTHLTGHKEPDLVAASRASHRIRLLVLELHRHICRRILDHHGPSPIFRL